MSNALGNVLSAEAAPEVLPPTPAEPRITSPPQGIVLPDGRTVVFEVTAEGTEPLTYQWQWQGRNLPGATSRTLTLPDADRADSGPFHLETPPSVTPTRTASWPRSTCAR